MMSFRKKLDKLLSYLLIVLMSLMVINVLWQVFTRYVLNTPSSFTDELARYLMIWVGILGAAFITGKNMHVSIDFVKKKFNARNQKKINVLIKVLITAFALLGFVIGGFRLVYISLVLGQQSPALQLPLAYVYMVIPISGIIIIYYKLSDLFIKNYE